MEKISILKFKNYLQEIFKSSDIDNVLKYKGISPVAIYILSKSKEKWTEIPNWAQFEENTYEYTNQEENEIFLNNIEQRKAILVSGTYLLKKEHLLFDIQNSNKFKIEYSTLYDCEFFQPEDYIIYYINKNSFTLIHNSGKKLYIKLN